MWGEIVKKEQVSRQIIIIVFWGTESVSYEERQW